MGFIRILLAFAFGDIRLRLDRVPCDVELYLVAHALFPFAALIVLTPEDVFWSERHQAGAWQNLPTSQPYPAFQPLKRHGLE